MFLPGISVAVLRDDVTLIGVVDTTDVVPDVEVKVVVDGGEDVESLTANKKHANLLMSCLHQFLLLIVYAREVANVAHQTNDHFNLCIVKEP